MSVWRHLFTSFSGIQNITPRSITTHALYSFYIQWLQQWSGALCRSRGNNFLAYFMCACFCDFWNITTRKKKKLLASSSQWPVLWSRAFSRSECKYPPCFALCVLALVAFKTPKHDNEQKTYMHPFLLNGRCCGRGHFPGQSVNISVLALAAFKTLQHNEK